MKIGIIGTGAYALALASVINDNGHNITMWTKIKNEYDTLNKNRTNNKLKNFKLPKNIKVTMSLEEVCKEKELIIFAIPAEFVDNVSREIFPYINNQHICIATKGIENDTCRFVDDVILNYIKTKKYAVISGPSFAADIIDKTPIGLALATKNKKTEKCIREALANNYLKLRTTNDIKGIEICGSIKNVIAIAAGMLDGMNMPESTKAMFITESLHDIKELIKKLGGNKKTILSFAGFGDLLLTCTSTKSRNFSFGRMFGQGLSQEEINEYTKNTTVEGLYTLKSIYKLINNKKVDMPIIDLIYNIVFNNKSPKELTEFLINKS